MNPLAKTNVTNSTVIEPVFKKNNMKRLLTIALCIFLVFECSAQDKEYIIATYLDKYVIDVVDGKFYNGAYLQLWEYYKGSQNQQFRIWKIDENSDYIIIHCANGFNWAFDVTDGNVYDGNRIQIWAPFPNSNNQRFRMQKNRDGSYFLHSALNDNFVLAAETFQNGARIVLKRFDGSVNQKWIIASIGSTLWTFFNNHYGLVK